MEFCSKYSDTVASTVFGDDDDGDGKARYRRARLIDPRFWQPKMDQISSRANPKEECCIALLAFRLSSCQSWMPWKWWRGRKRWSPAAAAAMHSNLDKLHLLSTLVEDGQLQVREGEQRLAPLRTV